MAKQLHINLRSLCKIPSSDWSGVEHTPIKLRSSGNVFSGMITHISLLGSIMDDFGLGGFKNHAIFWSVTIKFSGGGIMDLGCFLGFWLGFLTPLQGTIITTVYKDIADNCAHPTLWQNSLGTPFSVSLCLCFCA